MLLWSCNMDSARRKYYERVFQAFCDANKIFEDIRKALGCDVSEAYDDPASTAIDIGLDYLINIYLEEEFSIPDVWDELCEGRLYDYLCGPKWKKDEKFSLDKFNEIVAECLEEAADRDYAYPEEINADWECVL